MTRVLIFGSNGKMGGEVMRLLSTGKYNAELACGVDSISTGRENYPYYKSLDCVREIPDVIIDFSFHRLIGGLLDFAIKISKPIVIATTGFDQSEIDMINAAAKEIPIFLSANLSMGVALLADFSRRAAESFPDADVEIVEAHHNKKADAPSGTALMLARAVKEVRPESVFVYGRSGDCRRDKREIGLHALRMGGVAGEHSVYITTGDEQIVLKHTAMSRAVFAEGAIRIAEFLRDKERGLYDMKDYIAR